MPFKKLHTPVQVLGAVAQSRCWWTDVHTGTLTSVTAWNSAFQSCNKSQPSSLLCWPSESLDPIFQFLSSCKGDSHTVAHNHMVLKPRRKPQIKRRVWEDESYLVDQHQGPCARTPRALQQEGQSSRLEGGLLTSHLMPFPPYPLNSKLLYFSLEFNKVSYCCDTWQALPMLVEDPEVSNSLLMVTNPCQFQTDNFYLC